MTLQSGEFKRQEHLVERLLEEGFSSTDIASALIHQLQSGEAKPASRSPREGEQPRPDSAPFREERNYREDRGHREDRRERRGPEKRKFERAGGDRERRAPAPAPPKEMAHKEAGSPEAPTVLAGAAAQRSLEDRPARTQTERRKPMPAPLGSSPKHSRRTPEDQTRLFMNVGAEMGVAPGDVVGAILGETGLPAATVGTVDIRERHLFVDVAAPNANAIIAKLNRTRIKGHRLKVKVA